MLVFSAEVAEEVAELTQKWPNLPVLGGFDWSVFDNDFATLNRRGHRWPSTLTIVLPS